MNKKELKRAPPAQSKASRKKPALCAVSYGGPSVPEAHGARCHLEKGHDAGPPHGKARHWASFKGSPIGWYTPEQKAARQAEKTSIGDVLNGLKGQFP